MTYYLDTNICVSFLRGKHPGMLDAFLSHGLGNINIPVIVAAELIHGAYKSTDHQKNLRQVGNFLTEFAVVPFDIISAILYGKIRTSLEKRGQSIGPNDLFIAALTLSRGGILVTNNTREFSRIENLLLEDWTK